MAVITLISTSELTLVFLMTRTLHLIFFNVWYMDQWFHTNFNNINKVQIQCSTSLINRGSTIKINHFYLSFKDKHNKSWNAVDSWFYSKLTNTDKYKINKEQNFCCDLTKWSYNKASLNINLIYWWLLIRWSEIPMRRNFLFKRAFSTCMKVALFRQAYAMV